jgi:hypothetical protein
MRIFRVLYLSSLIMLLAGLGWLIYFFVTPVTEANVERHAKGLCVIGNLTSEANRRFALTPLAPPPLGCDCVLAKLRRQYGGGDATRLTDVTRQLFVSSVRRTLTRQAGGNEAVDRRDLAKIRAFFRDIGRECPARP